MTDTAVCPRCDRPVIDDAVCCWPCTHQTDDNLGCIIADAADLIITIARRDRFGDGTGGRHATDEAPLPVNLAASDVHDRLTTTLTKWTRYILAHRRITWPAPPRHLGPLCKRATETWCTHSSCRAIVLDRPTTPTIPAMAQLLRTHLTWLRRQPAALAAFDEIGRAAVDLDRCIDAPPVMTALGKCDAEGDDGSKCGTELRARLDAPFATCRGCGTAYDVRRRREQLLALVDGQLETAPVIAAVLSTWSGVTLPVDTIHKWASRGRITKRGIDRKTRQPLYLVREVKERHQQSIMRKIKETAA